MDGRLGLGHQLPCRGDNRRGALHSRLMHIALLALEHFISGPLRAAPSATKSDERFGQRYCKP